jgi:hypothetical protein
MYQFFAKAAILVVVAIVFGLARRYAPVSAESTAMPSLNELELRFSVTQWIIAAVMAGIGLFSSFRTSIWPAWMVRQNSFCSPSVQFGGSFPALPLCLCLGT